MAEVSRPTVTYRDIMGQTSTVSYNLGASLLGNWTDKSDNLKTVIDAYTEAIAIKRGDHFTHPDLARPKDSDYANPTAPYRAVDQKAMLNFVDGDGETHMLQIPSPKESMFYAVEGQGFRVLRAVGEAIAKSLSDELAITVFFVEGWLKGVK